MNPDSVDKNDQKDVQLQNEDIMYDIALSVEEKSTPAPNEADVASLLKSVQAISERFANTLYVFFLGKRVAYPVVDNYFSSKDGMDAMLENGPWSSYARAMIKLRPDVKLKDTIVVPMPKLVGGEFYMCTISVEYEWIPLPGLDVAKSLKNPRHAAKGVLVGLRLVLNQFRPVSNKNNANTSGKKNKDAESKKELVSKGANSGGSPSDHRVFHVESSSTSTTPVVERIDKLERQIIDGKLTLVDDDENPLPKVVSMVNEDSDSEVEDVFNKHAGFMASTGLKRGNEVVMVICEDFDITIQTSPPLIQIKMGIKFRLFYRIFRMCESDSDLEPLNKQIAHTLQQSGFSPATFRGFPQRHVAGENYPHRNVAGEVAGESSSGIQSPAIIPSEDVGPTRFSVNQLVPRWQTFPQRRVVGESFF
ncbi:hypothetical protein Tco_0440137 [Tanacetum coccineum]